MPTILHGLVDEKVQETSLEDRQSSSPYGSITQTCLVSKDYGSMEGQVAVRSHLRFRTARVTPVDAAGDLDSESKGWTSPSLCNKVWEPPHPPLVDLSQTFSRSIFIDVPHVRQLYNWDCGLACVLMVLKALGLEGCDMKYLRKLCGTSSVWTVDLAHLFRHFSIDVWFLTVTIGANPSFALETFYKENMEEDRKRVTYLFEKAVHAGIRIQRRSLSGRELSECILSGEYLAIALVDKRKLSHPWSQIMCLPECCGMSIGYTGHYVVICGYDDTSAEFDIRDPAASSDSHRISLDALEEARKTFGTDEDLLLVSRATSLQSTTVHLSKLSLSCLLTASHSGKEVE